MVLLIGASSCTLDEPDEESLPPMDIVESANLPVPVDETSEPTDALMTYQWVSQMQLPNGLLESASDTDFVSLYDNALAALVYIGHGDFTSAERIFDYFESHIEDELQQETGGFFQFRNTEGLAGERRWLGDNAWLLIALNNYHNTTGTERYQKLSTALERWIRSLQDVDGGLMGGTEANGNEIHKVTEGIITAFNAVPGYDNFHKGILLFLEENRWDNVSRTLTAWPENPAYLHALDLHPLGQGIFEEFPKSQLYLADDWYLTTKTNTTNGEPITGYCFDVDKDVVWLEGTAQMAMAFDRIGDMGKASELLSSLERTFIQATAMQDAQGIPYATNLGSTYGSEMLWDHADFTPALSSTAWYLLAKKGFDPLAVGKQKNIPETDRFWIQNETAKLP